MESDGIFRHLSTAKKPCAPTVFRIESQKVTAPQQQSTESGFAAKFRNWRSIGGPYPRIRPYFYYQEHNRYSNLHSILPRH